MVFALCIWPGHALDLAYKGSPSDKAALERTGEAIRAAFGRGDFDEIMAYHHPQVIKALSSDRYLVGREAVRKDLIETFQVFTVRFKSNKTENRFLRLLRRVFSRSEGHRKGRGSNPLSSGADLS